MSRLITFGCSNTYGQGLPDCHLVDKTGSFRAGPHPSKHAWPAVLGKLLNRETINLSCPGASNRAICYNVLNFSFEPTDIVVCHWSLINRYAVIYKDKPMLNLGLWDIPEWQIGESYVKYIATVDNDYDRMIESSSLIDYTNLYLKDKIDQSFNICFNRREFKDMPNWVSFVFDLDAAFYNVEYPLALDNAHTGIQGHRELAKSIYKLYTDRISPT